MVHRAEVVSSDDVSGTTWRLLANLILLGSQWKFENCFLYSPIRIHDFLFFFFLPVYVYAHVHECVRPAGICVRARA